MNVKMIVEDAPVSGTQPVFGKGIVFLVNMVVAAYVPWAQLLGCRASLHGEAVYHMQALRDRDDRS